MAMNPMHQHTPESVQILLKNGMTEEQVLLEILNAGMDEPIAREMITSIKKEKYALQQRRGFVLLGIGSLLCFLSCVFTMLHLIPSLTGFLLYGLTTFGVIIIFVGLIMVFE